MSARCLRGVRSRLPVDRALLGAPRSFRRPSGFTSIEYAVRHVDADLALSHGPTGLRGTFHAEIGDGFPGRLQLRKFPGGRDGGPDGGDRGAAALDGDRDRFARLARAGPLHIHRRRLRRFGAERQPLPDRRAGGRFHRAGGGDRAAARHGRTDSGDDPVGRHADGDRLSAARRLHQVHSLPGDGGLHRRNRGDDFFKRDQAVAGPFFHRRGARASGGEASLPLVEALHAFALRAGPLARRASRSWRGCASGGRAGPRCSSSWGRPRLQRRS